MFTVMHWQDMYVYGCHGDDKLMSLSQDTFMKGARVKICLQCVLSQQCS